MTYVSSVNFSIKTVQKESSASDNYILLLPCVDSTSDEVYYPLITSSYRKNLAADLNLDVRISDSQCKTILRNSADIVLPIVEICREVLISIGITLLSESIISFIKNRTRAGERDSTAVYLCIRIIHNDNTQSTEITYKGPVNGLEELSDVLEKVEQK